MSNDKIPVLISGGGASGELMAAALAQSGIPCRILAPETTTCAISQARTIAIWRGGLDYLEAIFESHDFYTDGYPIRAMSLIDETGQESCYLPEDHNLSDDYFGYNLNLGLLTQRARKHNLASDLVEYHHSRAATLLSAGRLRSEDKKIHEAELIIVAEGKDSSTAAQAGIAPLCYQTGTVAVIAAVQHKAQHDGFAREYHRTPGPLAFVPLEEYHSSIVWIHQDTAETRALLCDEEQFLHRINKDSLEQMEVTALDGKAGVIPLASRQSLTFRGARLALIGESAHKMPPTGAQGLNLTLRDIAELQKRVHSAWQNNQDIGAKSLLRDFSARRMQDSLAISSAVHLGNASIRLGGPFGWLRRTLQQRLMPQFPTLQASIIHRALYGF